MPKTKAQGILFGLIMSYSMAIGMEIYNTASALGFAQQPGGLSNLRSAVFLPALRETLCMGLIVFIVSNLWGNRIGAKIAAAQCDPARDHPTFCRLLRQAGTVAIMCPSMCLIGSILFQLRPGRAPAAELPAVWLGTLLKNLPMTFFWNMFAAAPFTRWLFRVLCPEKSPAQPAA